MIKSLGSLIDIKSFADFLEEKHEASQLNEAFKNFIGDDPKKYEWVDRVWDILQLSYKPIGGIKGNGFGSKEEMIAKIPFWKIFTRGDDVKVVAMYKDRAGRKGVAYGTDGSAEGMKFLGKIFAADLDKSFTEVSGPLLGFILKSVGFEALEPFFVVKKASDKIIIPDDEYVQQNLSQKDRFTWSKFPKLRPYFYVREIGGKPHLKISIGTGGKTIHPKQ